MKKVNMAWFPDDEQDAVMLNSGFSYQANKFKAALRLCRQMRRAIDIGAHCGLWTLQMARFFQPVEAFEPIPAHIECWKKNLSWKLSCHLHEVALGDKNGWTGMNEVAQLSGRSHVVDESVSTVGSIAMRTLDSYNFDEVDFIKVDVEGFEYFVLKGAEDTILRNRPVMVVEQKDHGISYGNAMTGREYLESLGAIHVEEISGDHIYTWSR